ncbi:tetratricopeptide repeat-containing serine protease family protein [Streptomyces sp. M7]|uniref:tetratricopeptide repeat-containing serine protease family protein n=1 Tax=Streptomyces sp. M7 TaxID=255705 RepID=UPI0011C042FB|nr:tetratricopeptide repeat-containing serine protease family protein [Streptomyces sp. M7]
MDRERVVAVDGAGGQGSGYVISDHLMLTSAHVVPALGGSVKFFQPGRPVRYAARVVWRGTPGGRDDAALLLIDDPAWQPLKSSAVRWGRLVTSRPGAVCQAVGVPNMVQRPDRPVELWQATGTINPVSGRVDNRHVVTLGEHPPQSTDGSPWGGLSGAAVFCGDLLTGVIAADLAGLAHAGLHAVPLYVLFHDQTFRGTLTLHAPETDTGMEPVEWQGLADHTDTLNATSSRTVSSPAALLRARRAVVPFRGREELLTQLHAWASPPGFGAWLIHGPGGQGKTRLAHHFATLLTRQKPWAVLWLRADAADGSLNVVATATAPALIVVDYAETRTSQLTDLCQALARHGIGTGAGTAVKVLLLARTAGDWWQTLQDKTPAAEELLDGTPVTHLGALESKSGNRLDGYREAADSFAGHLPFVQGWHHHDWPALAHQLTENISAAAINREGMSTALTLHMTALADLLDTAQPPHTTASPAPATGVEDRLLRHERRYWENSAVARALHPALTMDTLTHALAAAFLLGAPDRQQANKLLAKVPGLSDQSEDRRNNVHYWITALYPPADDSVWDSLRPDRLAERFTGRHLLAHPNLPDRLLPAATEAQAQQLLTVSTRAATHPPLRGALAPLLTELCLRHPDTLVPAAIDVAPQTETPTPLLHALTRIADAPDTTLDTLRQLTARLPDASHNLAETAAHLAQQLADRYRALTAADPDAFLPDLAMSLNNLSIRLRGLGRREEALAAIEEAVTAYRQLAAARPDAFLPNLATSLNNLSALLGELGQREEALAAIEEAVTIRRQLAAARPDAFLPNLATSLNNLSILLGGLGRREEALAAIEEAVTAYRQLAAARPDAFLPNLATSLNNLSIQLGELGRREDALAAIEEAVTAYRQLAAARPDAFLPDLATSLNNLSALLGELGQREEALAAIEEAVTAYRQLAAARPDAFLPDLAMSLNNLSILLGELGRGEEALAAIEEAVTAYRQLAAARPDAFLPDLAMSLNNLSIQLGELGQREDALAAIEEAVTIRRELAAVRPDAFLPDLATSLNNLSTQLGELGRGEDALAAIEEAVTIRRELAAARPDAFLPNLATSLNNLSTQLGELGRGEDALAAIEEAVTIRRQLAAARPDAFLPNLATSLNNLSIQLGELGRREDALAAIEEAVTIRRELAAARPAVHQAALEQSLQVLAWLQEDQQ